MTVSSAPIGNTGQSLDGFVAPVNFRESVVITDPNDQFGISTVVSTQPITGYAIPVWIQGTPNFSSTVNVTSIVNVSTSLSGNISSFAVNPLPGTTMVNVVSTVPQTITIGTVSTFPLSTTQVFGTVSTFTVNQQAGTSQVFGTVSTQIVSSIPLLVSQTATSNPWTVVLPGTTMVNVVSTVPQSITIGTVSTFPLGITSTQIISSIPLLVSQTATSNPWTVQGQVSSFPIGTTFVNVVSTVPQSITVGQVSSFAVNSLPGTTMVNVVSTVPQTITIGTVSTFPLGITSTQIISSIPLLVTQSATSNPWVISSAPIAITGTTQVNIVSSISLPFSLTGTTQVNIVSSIPLGGGVQYVEGNTTTNPTGNTAMWKSAVSTMVSVSTSNPLPVYQISTGPVGPLIGTTMVNVVSTVIQNVNIVSTVTQQVNITSSITQGVNVFPASTGGLIPFIKIGVTTASVQIKSGAGKVHDIAFTNNATSTRWLKFYNASSAAVGTTAPFMVFGMPGNTTGAQSIAGWIASPMGYGFSSNIFVAATASSATSTDTSAPASGDIVLNVGYI